MTDEKNTSHLPEPEDAEKPILPVTRRGFLKLGGVLAAAVGVGAAACEPVPVAPSPPATEIPVSQQYPEVPYTPMEAPVNTILHVFTPAEARTVEALTARILPGTPEDPGAREAGVVIYIDNMLNFNEGYNEPTYRQPPFAQMYKGDQPPAATPEAGNYQTVWVSEAEMGRYGYQSIQTPRETYRAGIAAVDRYAQDKFGSKFADLSEDQQDQIVGALADGSATGFEHPSAKDFFTLLRTDTINGMFSDPGYGGNRDMVGWLLIGYPGAQRAYTPVDIRTEGNTRPPQSMAMLHGFHPGAPVNNEVILPVSGSDEERSGMRNMPGMGH